MNPQYETMIVNKENYCYITIGHIIGHYKHEVQHMNSRLFVYLCVLNVEKENIMMKEHSYSYRTIVSDKNLTW